MMRALIILVLLSINSWQFAEAADLTTDEYLAWHREIATRVAHGDNEAATELAIAVRSEKFPNAYSYGYVIGLLHSAARRGSPAAAKQLEQHYSKGLRVPLDVPSDIRSLIRGDDIALSDCSQIVAQSPATILAKVSGPEGSYLVARCFYNAPAIAIDATVVQRLTAAAEAGLAEAQFVLAQATAAGRGMPASRAEALHWYQRAFEGRGSPALKAEAASRVLSLMVEDTSLYDSTTFQKLLAQLVAAKHPLGLLIGSQMEFAKADGDLKGAQGCELAKQTSALGYSVGQLMLGACHEHGLAGSKDLQAARKAYQSAAASGYAIAHAKLGDMHASGAFGSVDNAAALASYAKALELGYQPAGKVLAEIRARLANGVLSDR